MKIYSKTYKCRICGRKLVTRYWQDSSFGLQRPADNKQPKTFYPWVVMKRIKRGVGILDGHFCKDHLRDGFDGYQTIIDESN